MKKTFVSLLLLIGSFSLLSAQKTFEGTITYSYDVQGENAEMMKAMMPQKMLVVYGKQSMITQMEGGMMAAMMGRIVVNTENEEVFIVKDDEKTVYMMKKDDLNDAEKPDVQKVEKLEGKKEILGYKCEQYQLSTKQGEQEMSQIVWVTKDLKAPEFKIPGIQQMSNMILGDQAPGFPLQVEISMPGMNAKMIMTASDLDFTKPGKDLFVRPKDYEVKDFSEFMGGQN